MKDNINDINKKYCNNSNLQFIVNYLHIFLFNFFSLIIKNKYLINTKIYRLNDKIS